MPTLIAPTATGIAAPTVTTPVPPPVAGLAFAAGRVVCCLQTMGPEELGGTCEIEFDGLEIPEENRLMEEGDGLRLTQIRLGPARLTHCMRWLGQSKRAFDMMCERALSRYTHGSLLAEKAEVQNRFDALRASIRDMIDRGEELPVDGDVHQRITHRHRQLVLAIDDDHGAF